MESSFGSGEAGSIWILRRTPSPLFRMTATYGPWRTEFRRCPMEICCSASATYRQSCGSTGRGYLLEARGAPSRRPACPLHALEWARAALRQRTTSLGPFIPVLTRSRDRSRDKGDRVEIPGDPSVGFLQPQDLECSASAER